MFEKVIEFPASDEDPLFLPGVPRDAIDDQTRTHVVPALAQHHGIAVDAQGFPESSSLEAWHREHNSHLFE